MLDLPYYKILYIKGLSKISIREREAKHKKKKGFEMDEIILRVLQIYRALSPGPPALVDIYIFFLTLPFYIIIL